MEKIEQRAVIKYTCLKKLTPKEIYEDMSTTLGESVPSYTTVKKWVAEFKRGRESIEDDPRSGRPMTSTTEEKIRKICDHILTDRRLTIRDIADTIGISYERKQNIIVNKLGFSKVSARWVPRLLSVQQKRIRLTVSRDCLEMFEADPQDFMARFGTFRLSFIPKPKKTPWRSKIFIK